MRVRRVAGEPQAPGPAWEVMPETAPRAGAVLLHGYGSSKESMLGLALALAEAGFACLAPDLPGHGEHPQAFGPGVLGEVRGLVERTRRAHGRVLALGHSLGGRLALLSGADAVVAISPALPQQPSPEGIYALRTFSSPRVRQDHPAQVVEVLRDLPAHTAETVPVLVVVAEADIPSIRTAVDELMPSLEHGQLREVGEGMVLEAEDPPPNFGSYLKHWVNHGHLPATRLLAAQVAQWAREVFGEAHPPEP